MGGMIITAKKSWRKIPGGNYVDGPTIEIKNSLFQEENFQVKKAGGVFPLLTRPNTLPGALPRDLLGAQMDPQAWRPRCHLGIPRTSLTFLILQSPFWDIPRISLTFLILESPPGAAEAALTHSILILQHGPAALEELGKDWEWDLSRIWNLSGIWDFYGVWEGRKLSASLTGAPCHGILHPGISQWDSQGERRELPWDQQGTPAPPG